MTSQFPYSYYHGNILADQNDIYVTEVDNLIVMRMNQNTNLKFIKYGFTLLCKSGFVFQNTNMK